MSMNNEIHFYATLSGVKAVARTKDDCVSRRVEIKLVRDFDLDMAGWLGSEAESCRGLMQKRSIDGFTIAIDAYRGRMQLSGRGGNAVAHVDGREAKAAIVGSEDKQHEELTLIFEAPPEGLLLTFLFGALKESIEVTLQRDQLELPLGKDSIAGDLARAVEANLEAAAAAAVAGALTATLAEQLAAKGQEEPSIPRSSALQIPCRECQADPGQQCPGVNVLGEPLIAHDVRFGDYLEGIRKPTTPIEELAAEKASAADGAKVIDLADAREDAAAAPPADDFAAVWNDESPPAPEAPPSDDQDLPF